jgi:hypothetical protein
MGPHIYFPGVFPGDARFPMVLFTIPASSKQPAEFGNSAAQRRIGHNNCP